MNEINSMIKQFISDYSWLVSLFSAGIAIIVNFHIRKREAARENIYQNKMEEFKSDISKKEEVFNNSLAALSNRNEVYFEKKADAIQKLWSAVLKIREFSAPMVLVYGILLPEEYLEFVLSEKFDLSVINGQEFEKLTLETDKITSQVKPFIDAELWSKFSLYQAFIFRNLFLFMNGISKGKLEPWYNDNHLVAICNQLLGQYKQKDYTKIGSFNIVLNTMEELLVIEMREILDGRRLSKEIINQSIEIATELSKDKF